MRERGILLDNEGVLRRDPLIEPVPRYREVGTLDKVCQELGLSADLADFAACGLFDRERGLYAHQREAFKAVSIDRRSMVVTTSTGSGKTECFLLPMFEALLRESCGWSGPERPRAVRALILYPLNALVEDQMTRLRRALNGVDRGDQPGARTWLKSHRADRFTFGRYNGRTPVAGHPSPSKTAELNLERAQLQRRAKAVVGKEPELRDQFPSLDSDSGELWDRWSIQRTPPDVLVTNYSMLNIMLMRAFEDPIFDLTC